MLRWTTPFLVFFMEQKIFSMAMVFHKEDHSSWVAGSVLKVIFVVYDLGSNSWYLMRDAKFCDHQINTL